ncbi:MAG: hypothetical protein A2Z97_16685 [Bdellovibrionales bacterium GWB1_52_6]|nr:MAG: hypothetical protein A2Z97_16685 [Bdellovibrionales bacterium GWB1_52_6]OFZ03412.1 MAG: hypothetical protein A2X97_05555 [Bdellovibrionales bacterium GWA1_52_35]
MFSDRGRRELQEDHALEVKDNGIFVIADGFGGPVAGVGASKLACETVRGFLKKEGGDREATLPFVLRSYFSLAGNVLFNALIHANLKILEMNHDKGTHERGGASVLAAFLDGDLLALANVGSCSAWLFRNGQPVELVLPRTYARMIDPLSLQASPALNIPLAALGMAEDLEPEIMEYRIKKGDWILLQTDGLGSKAVQTIGSIQISRQISGVQEPAREITAVLSECQFEENATGMVMFF